MRVAGDRGAAACSSSVTTGRELLDKRLLAEVRDARALLADMRGQC